MAAKITVNAVDQTHNISGDISADLSLNGRATASFSCLPGYVPSRFQEVIFYASDLVTALFGGVIIKRSLRELEGGSRSVFTNVECSDFFLYADFVYTTAVYTADVTMKQVLTDLATLLAPYGITLDAGQVDGPTVAAFSSWAEGKRVSDAIRELMERCPGYVARISPLKKLRAVLLGTESAPYAMTELAPHFHSLTWADTDDMPANKVTLICGPNGTKVTTKRWTKAAGETSWIVDIAASVDGWQQGYVRENPQLFPGGHVDRTVSAPGGGGYYYWNDTAGNGTISVGVGAAPANGTILEFIYTALYPFTVQASTGATPVIEERFRLPDETDYQAALEKVASYLDLLDQQPVELDVVSFDVGWLPAQNLTVALPTTRFINTTFKIMDVNVVLNGDGIWTYRFKATQSTIYPGSYLDEWRDLIGEGSSIATVGGSAAGTTTVISAPVYMGGTDRFRVPAAEGTSWSDIYNSVPFIPDASFTAVVRAYVRSADAGVGIKIRLHSSTTDVESSEVQSTTDQPITLVAPVVAGVSYTVQKKIVAGSGSFWVNAATIKAA